MRQRVERLAFRHRPQPGRAIVTARGHPAAARIDDYAAWYRDFRDRLGSLSRTKQRQSALPLIHTWEHPRGRGSKQEAAGTLMEIPTISEAFIHKYLRDMCALGLIDPVE